MMKSLLLRVPYSQGPSFCFGPEEGFLLFAIILAALSFHDLGVNPPFFPISECKQADFKRTAVGHEV